MEQMYRSSNSPPKETSDMTLKRASASEGGVYMGLIHVLLVIQAVMVATGGVEHVDRTLLTGVGWSSN